MLGNIIYKGHSAFVQTKIQLEVFFDRSVIDPSGKRDTNPAIRQLRRPCQSRSPQEFPEVRKRRDKRMLYVPSAVAPPSNCKWCKQIRRSSDKRRPFGSAAADIDVLQKGGIDAAETSGA